MAKKKTEETPAEDGAAPELVTVKVIKQPLQEGGQFYKGGDTFVTTRERAEGLCALVEITGPAPEPAEETAAE